MTRTMAGIHHIQDIFDKKIRSWKIDKDKGKSEGLIYVDIIPQKKSFKILFEEFQNLCDEMYYVEESEDEEDGDHQKTLEDSVREEDKYTEEKDIKAFNAKKSKNANNSANWYGDDWMQDSYWANRCS